MTRQLQDVTLKADGKAYTLRWSWIALAALQDHWALASIDDVQKKVQAASATMSIKDLGAVVWAALQSHHPDIDPEAAFRLADAAGIEEMSKALGQMLGGSAPPQEAAAARPTTGKRRQS